MIGILVFSYIVETRQLTTPMPVMATRTRLSMVQHAIAPTEPGQIGVNPVDIPNLYFSFYK